MGPASLLFAEGVRLHRHQGQRGYAHRRISWAILAFIVSGGEFAMASEPSVAITLTRAQLPPEFSLKVARTDTPPLVTSLIVSETEKREIFCHLESTVETPVARLANWRYGEPVHDFQERRPCRALTAGRYMLIVGADEAGGSVRFEVDKNGRVALVR